METKILVINAGSSSIKWQIFSKNKLELLAIGLIERIGLPEGRIKMTFEGQNFEVLQNFGDHASALKTQFLL